MGKMKTPRKLWEKNGLRAFSHRGHDKVEGLLAKYAYLPRFKGTEIDRGIEQLKVIYGQLYCKLNQPLEVLNEKVDEIKNILEQAKSSA